MQPPTVRSSGSAIVERRGETARIPDVIRRPNLALTHIWWRRAEGRREAGLEEIDLSPAVHLAFDELELGDLPFGLALGPV